MAFVFNNNEDLEFVKTYGNRKKWIDKYPARYAVDVTLDNVHHDHDTYTILYYGACYYNRFSKDRQSKDTLNSISLRSETTKTYELLCKNESTGETFKVSPIIGNLDLSVTFHRKKHIVDGKTITEQNFQTSRTKYLESCFTVSDILKYYYYTNKNKENYGFPSEIKESEVKQLWNIVKKSIANTATPGKIPLGNCSSRTQYLGGVHKATQKRASLKIWDIKNHKHKWDLENFFNGLIVMDFDSFISPICAQNLLYVYLYGSSDIVTEKDKKIVFDEPKTFAQVIDELEDKDNHTANYVKSKLEKPLTSKQKEQIERYPDLLLEKGILTTFSIGYSHHSNRLLTIGDNTMYTYPLFAFRNIYIQDWIPDLSIYELYHIVNGKEQQQKFDKLKRKSEKQGKYIDPDSADKYRYEYVEAHFQKKLGRKNSSDWDRICTEKARRKAKRDRGREFTLKV